MELQLNEIRNKYFYRTERWDWLNEKIIHVFDSKRPRMITMNAWPQEVFLDADGQKTVNEYIREFFYRYPEGQAPVHLDKQIVNVLQGLLDENIVQFSDKPVTLAAMILKPLRDFGTVEMLGTWEGKYTYSVGDTREEVPFTVRITHVDQKRFSGSVEDNVGMGGTPGTGKVYGRFNERTIRFDKEMPIKSIIDQNGNKVIDTSERHPTIVYAGAFGAGKHVCSGTWKFKKRVLVWRGIIPYWVSPGTGTFTMSRLDS